MGIVNTDCPGWQRAKKKAQAEARCRPADPACGYVIDGHWKGPKTGRRRPYIEAHSCGRRPAKLVRRGHALCTKHLAVLIRQAMRSEYEARDLVKALRRARKAR
jgi:hypothetical protein